jgi:hypothetical protein
VSLGLFRMLIGGNASGHSGRNVTGFAAH